MYSEGELGSEWVLWMQAVARGLAQAAGAALVAERLLELEARLPGAKKTYLKTPRLKDYRVLWGIRVQGEGALSSSALSKWWIQCYVQIVLLEPSSDEFQGDDPEPCIGILNGMKQAVSGWQVRGACARPPSACGNPGGRPCSAPTPPTTLCPRCIAFLTNTCTIDLSGTASALSGVSACRASGWSVADGAQRARQAPNHLVNPLCQVPEWS